MVILFLLFLRNCHTVFTFKISPNSAQWFQCLFYPPLYSFIWIVHVLYQLTSLQYSQISNPALIYVSNSSSTFIIAYCLKSFSSQYSSQLKLTVLLFSFYFPKLLSSLEIVEIPLFFFRSNIQLTTNSLLILILISFFLFVNATTLHIVQDFTICFPLTGCPAQTKCHFHQTIVPIQK